MPARPVNTKDKYKTVKEEEQEENKSAKTKTKNNEKENRKKRKQAGQRAANVMCAHTFMHAMCNNVNPLLSDSFINSMPITAAAEDFKRVVNKYNIFII